MPVEKGMLEEKRKGAGAEVGCLRFLGWWGDGCPGLIVFQDLRLV